MRWRRQDTEAFEQMEQDDAYKAIARDAYRFVREQEMDALRALDAAAGRDEYLVEFQSGRVDMAQAVRRKMEKDAMTRGRELR